MEPNNQSESFTVKIAAADFLKVMAKLYGPISNLKFEWHSSYRDLLTTYDTQLMSIYKHGKSETGIEFEVNLWDFYESEKQVNEYKKIENEFRIANELNSINPQNLPLSDICINTKDIHGEYNLPKNEANMYLMYGDIE